MAAANAQIGVSESAFFPSLTLNALAGLRAPSLADLFNLPTRVWSLGPALAATLFDAGARKAVTQQAQASYDQSVASYRITVLAAFQEVEDNLASLHVLERELEEPKLAVLAATKSTELANHQYKAGITNDLSVAAAQTAELAAKRSSLSLIGQRYASTIGLIKALGGGF